MSTHDNQSSKMLAAEEILRGRARNWPDIQASAKAMISDARIDFEVSFNGAPEVVGWVKWDGCSDWKLVQPGYLHRCSGGGPQDLRNIGEALARCWDWAHELRADFE